MHDLHDLGKLHDLGNNDILQIQCMGNQLERQNAWKVLGMELDENLNWKLHVDKILKESYGILRMLKKLKRYTSIPTKTGTPERNLDWGGLKIILCHIFFAKQKTRAPSVASIRAEAAGGLGGRCKPPKWGSWGQAPGKFSKNRLFSA